MNKLFRRMDSDDLWQQIRTPNDIATQISKSTLNPACSDGYCSNIFADAMASADSIAAWHATFEKAYMSRVYGAKSMRCGIRISPSPFVLPRAKLQELVKLQEVLSAALTGVLKSWGAPNSWIRRAMPLSARATEVLLRCSDFMNGLPNTKLPVGSFRPDVLIGEDGCLRVCEINARFALNGFFVTLGCVQALHTAPPSALPESLPIGVVPSTQSLVAEIAKRFNPNETLFVIVGRERMNDLAVLEEMFRNHKDSCDVPAVRYVHPNQLRAGQQDGRLICATNDKSAAEQVKQCILELHQDELLNLSDAVLDGLTSLSVASRCLNPLWTIFLCHDKRLLGILRSLTSQELPDKEARQFLKEHIVPTTHLESIGSLKQLVLTHRGLMDTTLIAKPCLFGKGEGIILEKDFDERPDLFINAVAEAAERTRELAKPEEVFPYVVQSYVQQKSFNVLRPPDEDPTLTPVAWNIVATILCLDYQFLGPGIFRSSEKDIVALCNGGMMLAPALALPFAKPHLRFVSQTTNQIQADKVQSALVNDGLAILFLDKAVSSPVQFEQFIQNGLGAAIHQHSSAVGSVWTIQPKKGGQARSHTADSFLPHTDASFEPSPPRFFALSVVRADRRCGGLSGFASVEKATEKLKAEDLDVLLNTVVHWRRPREFAKYTESATTAAPVLFSRRRARVRTDIIDTSHLPKEKEKEFWVAYNRFYAHLDKMCINSARLLPENTVILMDNQRFVHARTEIKDQNRALLRIRFDLGQLPEVQSVLEAARAKGVGYESNCLADWPIQSKVQYMESINSEFSDRYRTRGGLYWSPSGGSTLASKGVEACAIPSTNRENRAMRNELVDLLCGVGAIPRNGSANCVAVNLFEGGNLYRSMEIFNDVVIAVNGTSLPLGARAADKDVINCIAKFGATVICGWGSRIIQLCQEAQSKRLNSALKSVDTIIHGGERLSATNRSLIHRAFGGNVRIFGCYGSAEAGVFGVSTGKVTQFEHETYRLLSDSVHVEIVDDSGDPLHENEWGYIVVTNLKRRAAQPLVRFSMGDIGRLVNNGLGVEKALQIKGRWDRALAFRLNPDMDFIFWSDVEKVIQPLSSMASTAGETCLAQIVVTTSNTLVLAIYTSVIRNQMLTEAVTTCSVAFSELVSSLGNTNIKTETALLNDMSELIRSNRSQKLMFWVDKRI